MSQELRLSKFDFIRSMPKLIMIALFACGALVLAWVGFLIWKDIYVWNKDIGTIFLGSRTGEAISLGIGMAVIHYFLIGVSLFSAGLVLFLRNRIFATEPQQAMVMQAQKMSEKKPSNSVQSAVKSVANEENPAAREEMFFSGCLHHFGYLSSRPKDSPIPQECILCLRLGDCMVATVYVKNVSS